MHASLSGTTFVQALATRTDAHSPARLIRAAAVLFVAALTAAAAQVSIPLPFTAVPFTFQPTVVLIGGLALGSRLGMTSQLLYLAAGLAGFQVFAASATLPPGPLRLLGPTGGYLLAYPLAAFVAGWLAERGLDRRYAGSLLALVAGLLVVYTSGVLWLALFARVGAESAAVGLQRAFVTGVLPFAAADLVKLAAAAAILPGAWRLLGSRSGD